MNSQEFIDALYPADQIGEDIMCLWTLPTKLSYWSVPQNKKRQKIRTAQENIQLIANNMGECYFGLGLVGNSGPMGREKHWQTTERADAKQVVSIPGVWADIDVASGGHKSRKRYPETMDKAMELIRLLPAYPSILVATGGGLHAYWLFDQILPTRGQDNNLFAAKLVLQWQAMVNQIFQENGGYTIDSTHDLSRVLRMPGTMNRKYSPARPVEVIHAPNVLQRYNLRAIDTILSQYKLPELPKYSSADAFKMQPKPMGEKYELDEGRLDLLFEMEPRAFDCYMMTPEFIKNRKGDNSPSSVEMSLANYAALYGFTDQEIATLLVLFRCKHQLEAKGDKHFEVTVMKARAAANAIKGTQRLTETVLSPLQITNVTDGKIEDNSTELLQSISDVIGIQIFTGFKRVMSEPPSYVATINGEDLIMGGIDVIITERLFQKAIADGTKYLMPKIGKNWNVVAQHILNVCVDVAIGYEGTTAGMHVANLMRYFDEKPPMDMSYEALEGNRPIEIGNDGYYYFSADDYKGWFYMTNFERLTRKDFYSGLNQAHAEPARLSAEHEEHRKITRNYYKISKSYLFSHHKTSAVKYLK